MDKIKFFRVTIEFELTKLVHCKESDLITLRQVARMVGLTVTYEEQ